MSDEIGSSEQDQAERVDDDVVGTTMFPPDQPFGLPELLGRETGVAGAYAPDSVAERAARERGDDPEPSMALPDGFFDDGLAASTDLVAELGERDLEDLVRLSDEEPARTEDPSPEAAAMHLVEEERAS